MLTDIKSFLLWLFWYTVGAAVQAAEYNRWQRSGDAVPWYQSSSPGSSPITGYDSAGWRSYQYQPTAGQMLNSQITSNTQNRLSQILEDGDLLLSIRNVLDKVGNQFNLNDLRSTWNSIRNGALGEQIETFLKKQPNPQIPSNGYNYDTYRG